MGGTPAQLFWTIPLPFLKPEIWIGKQVVAKDRRLDGSGQFVSGIDLFANTVQHENHHVQQIADADALLGALNGMPGTIWAAGWSWNINPTNHFTMGADAKPGVAGVDDDGNGIADDWPALFFAGSDDVHLDLNNNQVPDAWEPLDIEVDAQGHETIPEHMNW